MTNLPSIPADFPTPTPQHSRSMSQEQLGDHRTQISFEVEVILQGYWQTEMDPKVKAGVMADWADELQDWTVPQVKWGLREYRRENPRRKPNPGDILAVLKKRRGQEYAAKAAALPKADNFAPIVTDEARARNAAKVAELFPAIIHRSPEVK